LVDSLLLDVYVLPPLNYQSPSQWRADSFQFSVAVAKISLVCAGAHYHIQEDYDDSFFAMTHFEFLCILQAEISPPTFGKYMLYLFLIKKWRSSSVSCSLHFWTQLQHKKLYFELQLSESSSIYNDILLLAIILCCIQ